MQHNFGINDIGQNYPKKIGLNWNKNRQMNNKDSMNTLTSINGIGKINDICDEEAYRLMNNIIQIYHMHQMKNISQINQMVQ